jgi:uncharacterized repeat protein (TIGR01451 family)
MTSASDYTYLAWLHQQIEQLFSKDELRTLCFNLGEDYDNLQGKGKVGKARELVVSMKRQGRLDELVAVCERLRPNINWKNNPQGPESLAPSRPDITQSGDTVAKTIIQDSADLSIRMSGPASGITGNNFEYKLTVSNAGPLPATDVTVTDNLPSTVQFVSATASQGSCTHSGGAHGGTVTCNLGNLKSKANATATIVVVPIHAANPTTNRATVTASQLDPDTNNNYVTWNTNVTQSAATFITVMPVSRVRGSLITVSGYNWPINPPNKDLVITWDPAGPDASEILLTKPNFRESNWAFTVRVPSNASFTHHTVQVERHNDVKTAQYLVTRPTRELSPSIMAKPSSLFGQTFLTTTDGKTLPQAGVVINLHDDNNQAIPPSPLLSDSNGLYSFTTLTPGNYTIKGKISLNGQEYLCSTDVAIATGSKVACDLILVLGNMPTSGLASETVAEPVKTSPQSQKRAAHNDASAKTQTDGEPEWVEIPAGEFWMGSEKGPDNEKPLHQLYLDTFWIARTPVTNAQYRFFVKAADHRPPNYWQDGVIPDGVERHPVVNVTWDDALAYCQWLSQVTDKNITLPSEAEWEKAARGSEDKREYPWGDTFNPRRAKGKQVHIGKTSPVGSFPGGTSPYGVLDMSGNVWEWTRSQWHTYPYVVEDGREELSGRDLRVLRGGSWASGESNLRCSYRDRRYPYYWNDHVGFRIVRSPFTSDL